MKSELKHPFLVFCLLALVLPFVADGQTTTAITGVVMDSTGAMIAKASITAHNQQTGQNLTTVSTSTGNYTFPNLRPGVYNVSANAPGFDTSAVAGVHLHLDAVATVNLTLRPGTAKEVVTVHADEEMLDLTHSSRGETFTEDELETAPLNSGNPLMLANSEPAVTFQGLNVAGASWVRPFDHLSINQFSVNGGLSGSNDFQLDGSPNNTIQFGNRDISYVPPSASVQEMKFIANPYDAQYGHTGGGIFDIVTKYGGNKFHGQTYFNVRRPWLDANTELGDSQGLPKASDNRNIWGFQADGPVGIPHFYDGHDKTFFEAQVEIYRETDPQQGVASVPALSPGSTTQTAWQTGDFSGAYIWGSNGPVPVNIYNPFSVPQGVEWPGLQYRTQFPNNQIPSNLMNPVSKAVLSYLPLPNRPAPSNQPWGTDNYAWSSPAKLPFDNVVLRLDRNFGDKDRAYIRYSWQKNWQDNGDAGIFNSFTTGPATRALNPLIFQTHDAGVDWQHTFSANSLFGVHLSGDRFVYTQNQGKSHFDLSKIGLGGLASSVTQQVFPDFQIAGVSEFGNNAPNGGNKLTITDSFALMPMWTYIHGNHTMKVGVDYRLQRSSTYVGGAASGSFGSGGFWTQQKNYCCDIPTNGNGLASFLLGVMDWGYMFTGVRQYFNYPYYAPFFQDDWKVTHKLTLNVGVRWDIQGAPTESANKIVGPFNMKVVNPVDSTVTMPGGITLKGGETFAGVNGVSRSLFKTSHYLVQPRFGFGYALNQKTVVRGGIGTTYGQFTGQGYNQGFSAQSNNISSVNFGQSTYGGTLLDNPFPTIVKPLGSSLGLESNLGDNFNVVNPDFKIPGVVNYSLGVERQIGQHATIDVSYVGNHGYNMDSSDNINHISAAYAATCNVEMGAAVGEINNCINTQGDRSVANPFQGVDAFSPARTGNGNNYYYSSNLNASVYSRPYPEFGEITQTQQNNGTTEYDSLQVIATHNWQNNLTFHGNFVWSKQMNDGWWNDVVYRIRQHYLDKTDRRWRWAANADWHLPVGRGRTFLGHSNHLVDAVVGGWTMGAIYTYEAGMPSGVGMPFGGRWGGNLEVVHVQHYGRHNGVEGQRVLRGSSSCVGWYDPNNNYILGDVPFQDYSHCQSNGSGGHVYDFINRPAYAAVKNVSDSGVREPNGQNLDVSLSKSFSMWEKTTLQLRFEGYNVMNHPQWQGLDYWWDIFDPHFGTENKYYDGQTNIPRNVQISAKITW